MRLEDHLLNVTFLPIVVSPVSNAADRRSFVDLPWQLYAGDPQWRPPLKAEVRDLIGGAKTNPFFLHAKGILFLARRDGKVVGRIAAHVDALVIERRPGLGQWGLFETVDDPSVSAALIEAAEDWLRSQGMTRAQGPMSLSIWDEPGLLVDGFDQPPIVMMGHHLAYYAPLVLASGYVPVKDLHCWELPIENGLPELVNRIVAAGERNSRIRIRKLDMSRYDEDASIMMDILNEAWGQNWGYVPLTETEKAYIAKKLKPIAFPDLVRLAEVDGVVEAFMITMPDVNELTADLNGNLFPFGWAKLLWRLRKPRTQRMRVPLMGVRTKLQGSRLASIMAFMMIEYTRRDAVANFGTKTGEFGWVLEDNGPMRSIADAIKSRITRTYRIYERDL